MVDKLCEMAKMTSVRPELFSGRRKEQGRQKEAIREAVFFQGLARGRPAKQRPGKLVLPPPGSFLATKIQDAG